MCALTKLAFMPRPQVGSSKKTYGVNIPCRVELSIEIFAMDNERMRSELIKKIATRIDHDERWARLDFLCAQIFVWLTILASFFTAILAAAEAVPPLLLAFLAAIPGTVIVIEKSFAFSRRARWHWAMVAALEEYKSKLEFQNADVAEVAKLFGEFRKVMEDSFPILYADVSLSTTASKT